MIKSYAVLVVSFLLGACGEPARPPVSAPPPLMSAGSGSTSATQGSAPPSDPLGVNTTVLTTPSSIASVGSASVRERETFASLTLEIDGKSFSFDKACNGFSNGGLQSASAGAHLSPKRPPWQWMRGCDGTYASFYAGMNRTPEPGVSTVVIFDLRIPGLATQELGSARADTKSKEGAQPTLATFEITTVTPKRISGKFTFEARTVEGGPFKKGSGTFDLPRLPDDTSRGP
jgi:hypothetical protein